MSCVGLAPVRQLAEHASLQRLVGEHVQLGPPGGVNPHLMVPALVAGMVAGADSIEDMALLRHDAMSKLFAGVRAPSTLGTFLRSFTFGHVRFSQTASSPPGSVRCDLFCASSSEWRSCALSCCGLRGELPHG